MNKFASKWPGLRRGCIVSIVLLGFATPNALAAMYKWVDENGQVHYTQTPPPDAQFKQLKAPPPPPDAVAAQKELQELLDKQAQARNQRESNTKEILTEEQKAEQLAARCAEARGQLVQLMNTPPNRLSVENPDGSVHRMTVEEHASHLETVNKIINDTCR